MKFVGEWPVESHLINTHLQCIEAVSNVCWLVMGQHQFAYISPVYTLHECPQRPEINCSIYGETKT